MPVTMTTLQNEGISSVAMVTGLEQHGLQRLAHGGHLLLLLWKHINDTNQDKLKMHNYYYYYK